MRGASDTTVECRPAASGRAARMIVPAIQEPDKAAGTARMRKQTVALGDVEFDYHWGDGCTDEIGARLRALEADRLLIVTDDVVLGLHGRRLLDAIGTGTPVTVATHPPGESMKTMDCLNDHLVAALTAGVSKRSVVVSFGGGAPGNLAGVLAGLLFRGLPLIHVPTTTLAAMDSVLSLKQAINSPFGKNQIGSYLAPLAVFTDMAFLRTLPSRELRSGLCEMAKNCLAIVPAELPRMRAVLSGGDLASASTLAWLLDASVRAKTSVTRADTRETGDALVLEYGHTAGHAIELLDHGRRGSAGLGHGESIALGMLVSGCVAWRRGWLTDRNFRDHLDLVTALGVDCAALQRFSFDDVASIIAHDNKRGYIPVGPDEAPFVLLCDLGEPARTNGIPLTAVRLDELAAALEALPPLIAARTRTTPALAGIDGH